MSTTDSELRKALKERLSVEQNRVALTSALIDAIVTYYVDNEIKDVSEMNMSSLKQDAIAAWKVLKDDELATLPPFHGAKLDRWLAPPTTAHQELDAVTSKKVGEALPMVTEAEETTLFGASGPTDRELGQLSDDKTAQSLSGLRIVLLALSLELGRVLPGGEAVTIGYGSDPRLSDTCKATRKAGMKTLSGILEEKDVSKLGQHITGLIRDYSERGMVIEAQLITRWYTESQSMCGTGPTAGPTLCKYIRLYLDKYVGRGLPVVFDMVLLMRLRDGADTRGGESAEALKLAKEAKARADKAHDENERLKAELGRMRSEMARLASGGDPSGSGSGFKGRCHHCGEMGHRASECPAKAAEKAAKEAAKRAKEAEESKDE